MEQASSVPKAKAAGDFAGALTAIASLKPPVARYFDEVLVMADEAEVPGKATPTDGGTPRSGDGDRGHLGNRAERTLS